MRVRMPGRACLCVRAPHPTHVFCAFFPSLASLALRMLRFRFFSAEIVSSSSPSRSPYSMDTMVANGSARGKRARGQMAEWVCTRRTRAGRVRATRAHGQKCGACVGTLRLALAWARAARHGPSSGAVRGHPPDMLSILIMGMGFAFLTGVLEAWALRGHGGMGSCAGADAHNRSRTRPAPAAHPGAMQPRGLPAARHHHTLVPCSAHAARGGLRGLSGGGVARVRAASQQGFSRHVVRAAGNATHATHGATTMRQATRQHSAPGRQEAWRCSPSAPEAPWRCAHPARHEAAQRSVCGGACSVAGGRRREAGSLPPTCFPAWQTRTRRPAFDTLPAKYPLVNERK